MTVYHRFLCAEAFNSPPSFFISFLNFELKNQKSIQKLLSKSAQAQTYGSSGRAVILLLQLPGLDYPKTVRFPAPNYDKLPSVLLVRIRCSHVANVTYPALPHCFLIPATKTFSLTPVPLKLLRCFSSFFFKGLNGLITQSHSCSSKTT